jgi:hypothetical protein
MQLTLTWLMSGVLASTLVACSSTTVVTQWQDPSVSTTPIVFTKVLALVIASDQSLRRVGEQELCHQVRRASCTPAYLAVPDSALRDVGAVKAIVRKDGFDGALVFRILGGREKITYVPPSYGPGFWSYYGVARAGYDPGYYRADQVVRVETSIYSIQEDKLLWVGTTDTVNPDSVASLIKDVGEAVRKELHREGAARASQ